MPGRRAPPRPPGAPTCTRGYPVVGVAPPRPSGHAGPITWAGAGRACVAGLAPRLLRRSRKGDQGPGVDGAGLRAARLLLPRDRPQQARRRPVPGPRRGLRRRRRPGARRRPPHALRARFGSRRRDRRPRPRASRGRRRVPPRDQGPPRAEGASGQGLHRPLRRARGPRGGDGDDGGRSGVGSPRARRGRRGPGGGRDRSRCPRGVAGPDDAQPRRVVRHHDSGPASGSPTCGCPTARTCASPPPTVRPRSR